MNADILWLIIWSVLLFIVPIVVWAGAVAAVTLGANGYVGGGVMVLFAGIFLGLSWLIIVVYNIVMQVIALANGG